MTQETHSLPAQASPDQTSPGQASPANLRTVFAGLMMGMFLAAVNQTIIAPAMPRRRPWSVGIIVSAALLLDRSEPA